nr:glycosyltransferase family 39 protein [Chloroflexaceae bacterium]
MDIEQTPLQPTNPPAQPYNRTEPVVATSAAQPWWRAAWFARVALVLILLIAAYFRTLSLTTWDAGTGQHPDERFFRMVASNVRLPAGLGEYFDTARSPLNPRAYEQSPLYVYGLFPVTLTRLTAVMLTPNEALPERVPSITGPPPQGGSTQFGPEVANPERAIPKLTPLMPLFNPQGENLTSYENVVKVGRSLAVIFDLGAILLIYMLARRLFDRRVGLLAALLSALTVMQIQQSHFFVDPIFSTFFCLMALYWAVRLVQHGAWWNFIGLGFSIGMAMANRITLATLGLVAIGAALLW